MHFSLPGRRETVEISEQRRTITRLIAGLRSCTKTESSAIVILFPGNIHLPGKRDGTRREQDWRGWKICGGQSWKGGKERKTRARESLNFPSCASSTVKRFLILSRQRPRPSEHNSNNAFSLALRLEIVCFYLVG